VLKELIYELSRGFAYRRIEHDGMRAYTTWLPLVIAAILVGLYVIVPVKPKLVGSNGVASSLLTLVSTLPGFYFAGLAAVSTFGNPTMDKVMPSPAPKVDIRVAGKAVKVELTRRLFLSYLFSYLVIVSLTMCFALVALISLSDESIALHAAIAHGADAEWPWFALKGVVGTVLTFGFASLLVSTLHGIFFLTEKIHQP
jgi:hypothetical protein